MGDVDRLQMQEGPVVYFLALCGLIKIGFSSVFRTRWRAYETGLPLSPQVLAIVPGDLPLEEAVHRRFEHLHVHNEWFRSAPELLRFIESMRFYQSAFVDALDEP